MSEDLPSELIDSIPTYYWAVRSAYTIKSHRELGHDLETIMDNSYLYVIEKKYGVGTPKYEKAVSLYQRLKKREEKKDGKV